MRLVQIVDRWGDQELFHFDHLVLDEEIENWHKEFMDHLHANEDDEDTEIETIEQFMDVFHPEIVCERVFLDEIYV